MEQTKQTFAEYRAAGNLPKSVEADCQELEMLGLKVFGIEAPLPDVSMMSQDTRVALRRLVMAAG